MSHHGLKGRVRQDGLTLVGFMMVAALVVFAALVAFKAFPAVLEYYTIKKNINAIVQGGEARGTSVSDIRKAFDRRGQIDDMPSIRGADLDISKEGGEVVIGFSYARKVPLFGNVSLYFDFEGSTSPTNVKESP
jgi:protein-disulfide isomerase